jgi:hypothetical protein
MAPLLTDIEDRTVATAEGEFISFKVARQVFGTFYERNVGLAELSSIANRLSARGYLRWRIKHGGTYSFRKRASQRLQVSGIAHFTTSATGLLYLAAPRRVADQ